MMWLANNIVGLVILLCTTLAFLGAITKFDPSIYMIGAVTIGLLLIVFHDTISELG